MSNTISLAVGNTALTPLQPVLYVGQTAQLLVTLTNDTGADLGLAAGTDASTLDFYLPKALQLQPDVATLCSSISVPGWTAAANPTNAAVLRLTFEGGGGAGTTWADGAAISFTLANVSSQAAPTTAALVAVPTNVSGSNVPDEVPSPPLSLQPTPPAGAVSLAGFLEASLESSGILFVSGSATNPLVNTLQLNLKNTREDANGNSLALYSGTTPWADLHPAPQPQVTAWFVYDADSGGLAPDDPQAAGSAWNIALAVAQDQTGGWTPSGPVAIADATGPHGAPQWLLQPAAANVFLLGAGDDANLTVAFNDIVSLTPAGHTQLYLAFTGFWQDEQTAYEPLFLTLDIDKQVPTGVTEIQEFAAPKAAGSLVVPVNSPVQAVGISFAWCLYNAAAISLASSQYNLTYGETYTNGGVSYGSCTLLLPVNCPSGNINFTLSALDAQGNTKDQRSLPITIDNQVFTDAAGTQYATVQVGSQVWMAQNLNYDAGAGSIYYNNDPSNATIYGRLYTLTAAQQNIPVGWRLPTSGDFNNLVNTFGGTYGLYAYQPLIAGGSSGFEGQLGGWACIPSNQTDFQFFNMSSQGDYWSSSPSEDGVPSMGTYYLCFMNDSTGSPQVTVMPYGGLDNASVSYAVRYVCDI